MPVCETCDGEDYEEIDGFFYCTTCQTQSQAFRVEEIEDEFGTRPSNFLQIKAKKSQTNSSKEVEDKKKDFGRPWHTYEAFQKIIKEQVKSFIKLGADPALKDAVFKIWCEYLSLTGIAFPENPQKQKVIFSGYQRQREVYTPTIENPVVPPVRSRKTHLQKFGLSMQKVKKLQEKQVMSEALKGEEFYKGDNPLEEHSVSEEDEEDNMDDFLGSEESSIAMQDKSIRKRVQWMNMVKTLCFCYLGLRKIKCLVTASDIVRWVKQGLVPYMKATAHLPSDMKFSHSDYKVFKLRVPTVEEIYKTSERLQDFLKLTEFSVQVPTSVLISKFIVLLNLPAELHGFSQRLFLMRKEHLKEEIFDNNEVLAMMCIITTLQLMLGLNDRMEWELSKCAKQLMELPGFDHKLFCWEQWVSYINIHKLNGTYSNVLTNQFEPRSVKDIDRYVEEVKSLKTNVRKMNLHARTRYENKIEKEETISALKRPVYLLLEKVKEKEKNETLPWEDEDPLSSTHSERDPLGYIMGDYDDEQTENKSDSEDISFKSCSMKYITQPRSFVQELENCGLDESTIYSSCIESSDDEALEEMDIDEIDKHSDNFHTFSGNRKSKDRQAKSEMRQKLFKVIDLTQPGKTKCDMKKLSEISDIVLCVQENFPLDDPVNITTNQSASLQWLIQVCSEIIQCSVDFLQSELMQFQVSIFDSEHLLQTSRRNILQDIANQ